MHPLLAFLAIALALPASVAAAARPNIVLFVVDDLGWTDLACYGSDFHRTPRIDRLAAQGVRFTQAYSTANVCSPTRASLLTGKYPARLHQTHIPDASGEWKFARFLPPEFKRHLDPSEFTIAQALREAGYRTLHLGKWHLGRDEKYWPENRGFDVNVGGWRPGMPIVGPQSNGYFSPYGNPRLTDGPVGEYLTERLAREAVALIAQQADRDQPFFLNFWFYTVHTPLQAREEKIRRYAAQVDPARRHTNPVYAAMVEHLDDAVGRVIDQVDASGLADNTVVILTSDNGGALGGTQKTPERITTNAPLRSGKGDLFEGGVRVPFIVRWPGRIAAGTRDDTPVNSCDLYPTLLELAGAPGRAAHHAQVDGQSLARLLLRREPLAPRSLYWHSPHYNTLGARPYGAVRHGRWKLIEVFEEPEPMLFDLEVDPGEQHDLATSQPARTRGLLAELRAWRSSVKAQMPVENPGFEPDFRHLVTAPEWKGLSRDEILRRLRANPPPPAPAR